MKKLFNWFGRITLFLAAVSFLVTVVSILAVMTGLGLEGVFNSRHDWITTTAGIMNLSLAAFVILGILGGVMVFVTNPSPSAEQQTDPAHKT
jgi:hypothetical protein